MAQESANAVISGRFRGCNILKATTENLAYVDYNGQRHYLTKKDIETIEHIRTADATTAGDVLYGAIIAGAAGAMAANTPHNRTLLKVSWCDGSTSIIRGTDWMYETIIVGMHEDIEDNTLNQVEANGKEKVKNEKFENFFIWVLIALGWLLYEAISNF